MVAERRPARTAPRPGAGKDRVSRRESALGPGAARSPGVSRERSRRVPGPGPGACSPRRASGATWRSRCEAAADARVDAQRARLEHDAADQLRVDAARRLDGAPGGLLDLAHDRRGLARPRARTRSSARPRAVAARARRARRARRDLLELGGAALLDEQEQEVADELVRAAEDVLERGHLRPRVELRVRRAARRARAPRASTRRSRRAPRGRRRAVPSPSRPRRARARTCGRRAPICADSCSSAREVEVPDRVLDQRAVGVAVEPLPRDLLGGGERELGDLGADLLERPGRLGLDLPARLLEPALAVGVRLLLDALAHGLGDAARLGEDLLRLARAPAPAAPCAPRAACATPRARAPPRRATRGSARAARR